MKVNRFLTAIMAIVIILSCSALTSCENNTAKVEEAQDKYAELIQICNDITGLLTTMGEYGVEFDQANVDKYNEGINYINELGEVEISSKSVKELNQIIEEIDKLINDGKQVRAEGEEVVNNLGD